MLAQTSKTYFSSSGLHHDTLLNIPSGTLSGISSDLLSGISSGYLSGTFFGMASGILSGDADCDEELARTRKRRRRRTTNSHKNLTTLTWQLGKKMEHKEQEATQSAQASLQHSTVGGQIFCPRVPVQLEHALTFKT